MLAPPCLLHNNSAYILFQDMGYQIDPSNIQLKMFRLHCASERMRKAKILFRDSLNIVLDDDPASGGPSSTDPAGVMTSSGAFSNLSGSVATSVCQQGSGGSAKSHPMQYKCKRCRRILATAFNLLPHCRYNQKMLVNILCLHSTGH